MAKGVEAVAAQALTPVEGALQGLRAVQAHVDGARDVLLGQLDAAV
jgi:hypothetical protein